jgi:hypothetical protein
MTTQSKLFAVPRRPSEEEEREIAGRDEGELTRLADALARLAGGLEPEEARVELKLRGQLIDAEHTLFLTRRERAKIVAGFKSIYGPRRQWSQFCRIVNLRRQTSYDLLGASREEDRDTDGPESVQTSSAGKMFRLPVRYTFDTAVDKAVASLNRIFSGLTETQREQALDATVNRIGAKRGILFHLNKKNRRAVARYQEAA